MNVAALFSPESLPLAALGIAGCFEQVNCYKPPARSAASQPSSFTQGGRSKKALPSPAKSFYIHGARGTMPPAGRQFARYGTQTTCFSLRTPQGLIVIDAGTGIIALADHLARAQTLPSITILFTHFHLDHLIGLPLFKPLYQESTRITLMADSKRPGGWQRQLQALMGPPYWPVKLAHAGAAIRFKNLPTQRPSLRLYGIDVSWCPLWHPQQCLAYRLDGLGRSIVVATDYEPGQPQVDKRLRRFCYGADVLVLDAQYTPREKVVRSGWGHASWREAVAIAQEAQVAELILTHHDRYRSDAQIDALVKAARRYFPRTRAASDGMLV